MIFHISKVKINKYISLQRQIIPGNVKTVLIRYLSRNGGGLRKETAAGIFFQMILVNFGLFDKPLQE